MLFTIMGGMIYLYKIMTYRDLFQLLVMTKNNYYIGLEKSKSHEELMKRVCQLSRDNSRIHMQWYSSENGGFTKGES